MAGIKISNSFGTRIIDCNISDYDIGIEIENSDIRVEGASFNNVRRPFVARGTGDAHVERTRIRNDPKIRDDTKGRSTYGYRRLGPPLPAQCPHCKAIFPSRNYEFGAPHFYSRDNEETCRVCKRDGAKLSDGLFDLSRDFIEVLQAPDITYAMIAALGQIAESFTNDHITSDEAVNKFEDVDPRFGKIAKAISDYGSAGLSLFMTMVTVAGLLYTHYSTMATLESRDLAREQTAIARESLRLQKIAPSTDEILKDILKELSGKTFVHKDPVNPEIDRSTQQTSGTPTESKPPTESSPDELKLECKPKARQTRKRQEIARRRMFNPRHCKTLV